MVRQIIHIDEEKCDGCGLCAEACHENALAIVDGKAKLIRDDYCDGMGDCLPSCPKGAITFERREAAEYTAPGKSEVKSQLKNWPVEIKLAPVKAPYFDGASLLIAADCTAYAYANFHQDFIKGRITLVGCPKLDAIDYSEKLTEILKQNDIKEVTLVRMQVPCCGGLAMAAEKALSACGKSIPLQIKIISIDGRLMN